MFVKTIGRDMLAEDTTTDGALKCWIGHPPEEDCSKKKGKVDANLGLKRVGKTV